MGPFRRATKTLASSVLLVTAQDGLIDRQLLANQFVPEPAQTQFTEQATREGSVNVIRVGPHAYHLLRTLQIEFDRLDAKCWRCFARGLRGIEGEGQTIVAAYEAFCANVHTTFQHLYTTRPFEMNADQRKKWLLLCSVIDVLRYREETPITIRQLGRIVSAPIPSIRQVRWIHRGLDSISLLSASPEFAGYGPGQWFDAIVKRDLKTGNVVEIVHSQRMDAPPAVTGEAAAEYFRSLPIERLPGKSWEW